jgi:isocitrate dehydrogenase kinase/phosphatase
MTASTNVSSVCTTSLTQQSLDDATWQQVKLLYIGLLLNHKQPELAESFFNSVTTKILHRDYFRNDFIFVRPTLSTENIEAEFEPTYRSYYAVTGRFARRHPQDR